jgi:acetyl/propionyl-CoA carboxylase alpha subunit
VREVVRKPRAKKGEGLLGDVLGMFGGGAGGRHTIGTKRSAKQVKGEGLFSFIPGIGDTLDKLGNSALDFGIKAAPGLAFKALAGGGMKGQRRR